MATAEKATYEELESRLQETEEIIGALRHHEVDAIVGESDVALVRLQEEEEALRKAQEELGQRVEERTAELARVNQELHETYARLLKAQQIARIGNWEVDLESHAVWWSDQMYRLLGLEPGQVEPTCELMSSFAHPDDREELTRMMGDAMEHKRPFCMDHRVVRADGEERVMHTDAQIISGADGRAVQIVGTMQCITERKLAELKLEQSTSQLRDQAELLDLAHDMIFVHDMEGRIVFWNRGAEHRYGWTRQEAQGQLSHQLLQTEYCEPLIRITTRIIREGRWEGELVHTTRDGRKITVASRWALRRGPAGRPVAILEIDNDITDRKHAEQEMAEAKRFAESIVHTIQESLVVLDPQLRIVSANPSFHGTFGTAAGQIEGRPLSSLGEGQWEIPAALLDRLGRVLPENSGFENCEIEYKLPDRQAKWLTLSAWPIHGPAGGPETILLVIQDVTVRRQHEEEIRKDKEQLTILTEELLSTEERQRQRIAAALHDSISQSLAFAKREVSALERKAPDPMRETLRQVCDQIAEAIGQVRNLTLELAPSILYTLGLEAALEDLAEQFTGCDGFVCRVHATEEPKPLNDQVKSLLYRAVRELLVNVSKHAQAKNVSIVVERDEKDIRIMVEDDGRGFDPDRAKPTSAKSGGFGIFSIRQRLTYVGGKLTLESAKGKGTKVILTAPLNV